MSTITELIEAGYPKHRSHVQIATKRNGKWVETSVDEFKEKVKMAALGFYDLGIRKGDRVALHSENSAEWIIVDQAVMSIGAINVPIYTTQPGDQIEYILSSSETKIYVVSTQAIYDNFVSHRKKVKCLTHIVTIFDVNEKEALSFDDVLDRGRKLDKKNPKLYEKLRSQVKSDDLASFIYTSGTTGVPKGVMLTHGNIHSNMVACLDRIPFDLESPKEFRILAYLPLSHILERMLDYLVMHIGYPIYYIEKVDDIIEDFKYVKPYFFGTVPRLLEKVHTGFRNKVNEGSGAKKALGNWALDLADSFVVGSPVSPGLKIKMAIADKLVYSKLREAMGGEIMGMISGGAALAPQLMNFFNAIGLYCGQGYGLTETSPVLTVTERGKLKPGTVGRPVQGVEVVIAEDGEILARGPNIMVGYHKLPEETAEVLSKDGWFKTGDIGKFDEDGFLYITDRKKDIFKLSTGKYVAPAHIENNLAHSKLVEQVAVLGSHKKFCSALIVPNMKMVKSIFRDRGINVDENSPSFGDEVEKLIQEEVDRVNEKLPPWETIKRFALIDSEFTIQSGELTPSLKLKRRVIQEKFHDRIESIYKEAAD